MSAVAEQTLGFAINYIHVATYHDKRNCQRGGNGGRADVLKRTLEYQGVSKAKIEEYISKRNADEAGAEELRETHLYRGRLNGEPANINHYPASFPYRGLETVAGPYAYGFDLDGKGSDTPGSFQDPETHQRGVDNQLFRVVGCYSVYDISYPTRPWFAKNSGQDYLIEGMAPAWLFAITLENPGRDGKAEVSFYRAVGHLRRDNLRNALANVTYVIDSAAQASGTFRGKIENGVFTSTSDDVAVEMEGVFPGYLRVSMSNSQLRLDLGQSDRPVAYLGGYMQWLDYWVYVATVGGASEKADQYVDTAETYHALKRFADADPDPISGENTAISSTLRIDAVPAFLVQQDGTFITGRR